MFTSEQFILCGIEHVVQVSFEGVFTSAVGICGNRNTLGLPTLFYTEKKRRSVFREQKKDQNISDALKSLTNTLGTGSLEAF